MNNNDRINLLKDVVQTKGSQAAVGRILGCSGSCISQVLRGIYPGDTDSLLVKVEEKFGRQDIACPILGIIKFPRCVEERRRDFSSVNPLRVRLFQTCPKCRFNTDLTTD